MERIIAKAQHGFRVPQQVLALATFNRHTLPSAPHAGECLGDPLDQPLHRLDPTTALRPERRRRTRLLLQVAGLAVLFMTGLWLRSLPSTSMSSVLGGWQPWARSSMVTLYFSDGEFLFPVSRRIPANDDLPRAALQALLDGPGAARRLQRSVPSGVAIRSLQLGDGMARIDLSAAFSHEPDDTLAETAVVDTMTALPGVSTVTLSVEGKPLAESAQRVPLLYYPSANGLVAVPASVTEPRAALTAYLAKPAHPELTGFPGDARLLNYGYDPVDRFLSLNFTYSPSVRELALEKPERMRTLLLGLITSLTEFPEVRAVQLDFEGRTRLGLGECSDLLRTPQTRPQLLNDERLLDR
jgi:spore germination protein GerM